jgi:anti-sigma factor RsiW
VTDPEISGITPEAILAYLDGEELPHVAAYLQTSPEGATLAAEYQALQGNLARVLYRHDCPTTQQLGDHALRLPAQAERVAIAAHVTTCPHCAGELAQIRTFLAIEADPPPLSFGERARRIIVAALAPPPATAPTALRGSAESDTRTYQADDITITLDVASGSRRDRRNLTGLAWRDRDDAAPVAGATVALLAAGDTASTAAIDELGNFAFDDVLPGDYRLEMTLGDDVIMIALLRIGR